MDSTEQQELINKDPSQLFPFFTKSVIKKKQQFSQSINSALATTVSKIGEFKTNILYSIKHSDLAPMSRKEIQIKEGTEAQLLGRKYGSEEAYKFLFVFRNTFWFTYRKGIKEIQSDNGWGCMIRTVQMVFAEVLKRRLAIKETETEQYEVIRYFCEQSDGVLSLSAVCKEGQINKRWTSALQIFAAFKNIMKTNQNRFQFYFEIYSSGVTYKRQEEMLLSSYPAMVSLSNRVSLDYIPEQLQPHYFKLMDHASWVGTIGGLNGQALYIIGSYQNKVLFLDPHYVQSNSQQLQVQTYFCKTPRGIDISALSPSLSFCYYFANKEEHLHWIRWISKTCEKCYPNTVFQFMNERVKDKLDGDLIDKQCEPQVMVESPKEDKNMRQLEKMQLQIVSEDSGQFQLLQ